MPDTSQNVSSLIYNFLIDPRFRVARHLLLITGIGLISLNQVFSVYEGYFSELGYWIYAVALFAFLSYLLVGYYNLFVLVPKYLMTKDYIRYLLLMVLSISLRILLQLSIEYVIHTNSGMPPGSNSMLNSNYSFFVDFISSFSMETMCIVGVSVTILLKYWLMENKRIAQLEKEHFQLEVEQLKEQINPVFLFNILNRAGGLALTDTEKTSKMLMDLSQILRYQLYDSTRMRVLLSSEITFLNDYLALQQLYSGNFEFSVKKGGEAGNILIPPLLFIPFVQNAINEYSGSNEPFSIDLEFETAKGAFLFYCTCRYRDSLDNPYLSDIKERLSLLYESRYKLAVSDTQNGSKRICLKLN